MVLHKLLVIGGAGFVGSHLVDVALRQGCQVWVLDNFSTGKRTYLNPHLHLHIVEADLLDDVALRSVLADFSPDVVCHLAAIHYIPACEKSPEQAIRVNVEGTQHILTACAQQGVERVVFASTGALYDPTNQGALTENSPVKAQDVYGITKLACEQLVQHYTSKHNRQAVVGRLFNTVGRRETNPHVIPTILAQLAVGSRQVRLGNLHPRRDYVHVEDVAEAFFALAQMPFERSFDVFNIGSGQETSVRELMERCAEVIGEPLEILSVPELQRKTDRPSQLADLTKIQAASGWKPCRTLQQALAEAWAEIRQGA
jgi:UDP-glucose 4-epimerase